MKFRLSLLILAALAASTQAAEDNARAQIVVATKDAVANLLAEVSRTPLTRTVTCGEFINRTRSTDEVVKVLQRAQQIGGPRWIDDKTCQIELQISGPVVAAALKRAAAANPKDSPLAPGELSRAVKDWDERSFAATGVATSRIPIKIRRTPKMGLQRDPWWDVPESAREQAVTAAKTDAARRSLASVKPISLTNQSDVADVLALKDIGDGMQQWLVSQPVGRVELQDNLQAEVELVATPADTFERFHDLAVKQKQIPLPADEQAWDKVKDLFERKMVTPIGRGAATPNAVAQNVPIIKAIDLPKRPPAWVTKRLEASATGAPDKSKLLAARAAEAAAEEKLRKEILELPLTLTQTIAQAAKEDPRITKAIDKTLLRTRIGKADYHADGSADIAVYLDLDTLWRELRESE